MNSITYFLTATSFCKIILFPIMVFVLSGCILGDSKKLNHLNVGMTKHDALEIMQHNPDTTSAQGNVEYMIYNEKREKYFIRLVNGKVEAYGRVGDFDSTKSDSLDIHMNVKSGK